MGRKNRCLTPSLHYQKNRWILNHSNRSHCCLSFRLNQMSHLILNYRKIRLSLSHCFRPQSRLWRWNSID